MAKPRILVIGDSNCLPRRSGALYRETWIALLKSAFPQYDVVLLADGTRTTEFLAQYPQVRDDKTIQYDPISLEAYEPCMVILALGIVDCAPRLLSRGEAYIISKIPAISRGPLLALLKRVRRRSTRRAYVSIDRFEELVAGYLERCRAAGVRRALLVGISDPDLRCVSKNINIREAIQKYNKVYAELAHRFDGAEFIEPLHPEADISRLYVDDGYHLSREGHRAMFEAIDKALKIHENTAIS